MNGLGECEKKKSLAELYRIQGPAEMGPKGNAKVWKAID